MISRTTCPRDAPLLDAVSLAKFVEANWVRAGRVALRPGAHRVRIELTESMGASAFDAFLLTTGPFLPRGKLKPDQHHVSPSPEWFAFDPDRDRYAPTPIDLRSLNEDFAGQSGFIQTRGAAFVHEKTGHEVRFWGVSTGHDILNHDRAALDRYARRLAKHGVNLVRVHGPLWRDDDLARVDQARLLKIQALAASLRREGIYLALSIYFPTWLQPKNQPGLEGFDGSKNSIAIAFFNDRFQELQKGWWKAALTAPNPYTGVPLVADPALAFIEILNEDSLLFWTFDPYKTVPGPQMAMLERKFGDWLATRYGLLAAAFDCWRDRRRRGDDVGAGRAGFMRLWDVFNRRDARARDTAEFLARTQRTYFDQMYRTLKTDLGFRGSVSGSNWITADARLLGPLDKWSNAGCDFLDRHGYFGGPHEGERAGYALSPGDRYDDASALLFKSGKPTGETAFELPLWDTAWAGRPSMVSEINWVMPNRFRAELPVLAAAYGALQGTDGILFFATSDVEPAQVLGKFPIADPAVMGQFPATALIYRKRLVKTADAVVHLDSRLDDLFALKGLPAAINPLAFLAGRVEVSFAADKSAAQVEALQRFIDRRERTVRSQTGELSWDWERGLVTLNAPSAQGAAGFLSRAGRIVLGEVAIVSPLAYGSVLLVALDGRPIRDSRRLLLQVMSEDTNAGWSAPGQGMRLLVDPGGPPILIRKLAGHVSLTRPDAGTLKVRPLDLAGYPVAGAASTTTAADLTLLPTTLYYLIEK